MPYERRKYRRNKKRKTKRLTRRYGMYRRFMRQGVPRDIHIGIHYFKRSYDVDPITYTTTNQELTMALSLVPNVTEFSTLFDHYMILGCLYTFTPMQNIGEANTTTTTVVPRVRIHIDRDGGGPYSPSQLLERPHKDLWMNKQRKVFVRAPAVQGELYRSVTSTGYSPKKFQWIDMATTDIPHYSLCYSLVDSMVAYPGWTVEIKATLYFKCKGVR